MTIGRIIGGIYRRIDRYIRIPHAHSKFNDVKILDPISSIQYIKEHRCSVSRFGDEEFCLIRGGKEGRQNADNDLSKRLLHVLISSNLPNHIVGIPYALKDASLHRKDNKEFWDYFVLRNGNSIRSFLSSSSTYVDTQFPRLYSIYDDDSYPTKKCHELKRIWEGQDIVFVGEAPSDTDNVFFENSKSVVYIQRLANDEVSTYDDILHTITNEVTKDKLILLCNGQVSPILAYDLAMLGYWAIDLRYLSIEYEWYRISQSQNNPFKEKRDRNIATGDNNTSLVSKKISDLATPDTHKRIKISIIVPVYNAEKRIRRCIDSILTQKMDDFECILVDDGSTDHSPAICDMYAKQDTRIMVIHKKNGGVSSARNAGLEKANGEWVIFVDSDDFIKSNHLSSLYNATKESGETDFVLCGHYEVNIHSITEHSYLKRQFTGKSEIAQMFYQTDLLSHMTPWDKMFRRSVIEEHHMRFDKTLTISEDRLFCYEYLRHVRGVAISPHSTYMYDSTDSNSLSYKFNPFQMLAHRYAKLSLAMKELVQQYGLNDEAAISFIKYDWTIFKSAIYASESEHKSIINAARQQQQFYSRYFDKSLYTPKKNIISLLLTKEDILIFQGKFKLLSIYMLLRRFIFF